MSIVHVTCVPAMRRYTPNTAERFLGHDELSILTTPVVGGHSFVAAGFVVTLHRCSGLHNSLPVAKIPMLCCC